MADPYWRYAAGGVPERVDAVPRASFPGYSSSETSFLTAHHLPTDMLPMRPGAYGLDEFSGVTSHAAAGLAGLAPAAAAIKGFPKPLEDPALRREGMISERPGSLRTVDGVLAEESSILFVDGLPSDCTRREVAHLFRPFIGFKEIRLVHKEPRHSRDKATVLCFVEFSDAKCALTAMEALQSYKFDDKKPEARSLKIQFAHFPFRPPATRGDDQRRL